MVIAEVYQYQYLKELLKEGYNILIDDIKIPLPDVLMDSNFPILIGKKNDSIIHTLNSWNDIISFVKEKCSRAVEPVANHEEFIENCITGCLCDSAPDLIITRRIMDGLKSVVDVKIQIGEYNPSTLSEQIQQFIDKPDTLAFITERQPELSKVPMDVIEHIQNYFKENLNAYEVTDVCRKSNHLDDCNLYSVIARRSEAYYNCWTSWNDKIKNLNHVHYGLSDKEDALAIIKNNYHDITGEVEKYGIERSRVEIQETMQEKEKEYDNVISFRSR